MKGAVFLGDRRLEVMDFPDPPPKPDEVVIEIRASGMCGTDLHQFRSPLKRPDQWVIAGHEPCGVVVAVGQQVLPQEGRIGDRVLVHHYDGCRVCAHCRAGWTQICDEVAIYGGPSIHGSHARYMKVPGHTLIKLPEALSFQAGAAISCGTGTAYGGLKRVDLRAEDSVAIFGQGPVGLAATQFATAMGARVIAVDISDERLAMAKALGADVVINPLRDDAVAAIRDVTYQGRGVEKALECSSNREARAQAVKALRKWGKLCLLGVNGSFELEVAAPILEMKEILGSWTFSKTMLEDCAQFAAARKLDIDAVFTHQFRLDQAAEAYALFDQQKMGKGVFLFEGA